MQHSSRLTYHPLSKAIALVLFAGTPILAVAEDNTTHTTNNDEPITKFDTIVVVADKAPEPTNKDVTGLGKISKTAKTLKEQHVEGIRDLTRYDPGVAVNEASGRGTSTGFSIRGVEKDRVAVTVDGLAQAEAIKAWGHGSGIASGGTNETEYENLKLVEIDKGANSTYAGSGALGGAVLMKTKDIGDFVSNGKDLGGHIKLGYTSKDRRRNGLVGLGGRKNGWEGFVQYTKRSGNETRPHDDVYNLEAITIDDVIIEPKRTASIESTKDSQDIPFTYRKLIWEPIEKVITLSPEDYTGPDRKLPNPLEYDSQSLLSKVGYNFNNENYVGLLFEDTKQTYDMRDMFSYGYHSRKLSNSDKKKLIKPEDVNDNEIMHFQKNTPVKFIVENHHNIRKGLEYKYNPTDNKFIDTLTTNIDANTIDINTQINTLNCSKFPTVDKNCEIKDIGDFKKTEMVTSKFDNKRINLDMTKHLQLGNTKHKLTVSTGLGKGSLKLNRITTKHLVGTEKNAFERNKNGVDKYNYDKPQHNYEDPSNKGDLFIDVAPVYRKNYFVGINDNIHLLDNLDITAGIRFDKYSFHSNQGQKDLVAGIKDKFENSEYKNTSYNLGVAYSPITDLELTYKYGTGFRVPSMSEQIGYTPFAGDNFPQPKLNKEVAKSHEIGVTYFTDFGSITGSYFRADYTDFIAHGTPKNDTPAYKAGAVTSYFNLQEAKVHGFNLALESDLNTLWEKIPVGLQAKVSAGMVKMREKPPLHPDYFTKSYALDMIQPLKIVYGLSYDHDSGQWGGSLINTYSKGKSEDELEYLYNVGWSSNEKTNDLVTDSWITTDLTGYYHINDNIILRGGIFNLFNNGYITWESARSLENVRNDLEIKNLSPYLLAAPGRNYGMSLEFTF